MRRAAAVVRRLADAAVRIVVKQGDHVVAQAEVRGGEDYAPDTTIRGADAILGTEAARRTGKPAPSLRDTSGPIHARPPREG